MYESFEDLPEDVAKELRPFNVRVKMAGTDKLNPVQRAFVKYFVQCELKGNIQRPEATDELIKQGLLRQIWQKDSTFDGKGLYAYLYNRMKYEMGRKRKQRSSCDELLVKMNKKHND